MTVRILDAGEVLHARIREEGETMTAPICRMCRYNPVLLSWRKLAIIVKACRRNRLCLDCYANFAMRQSYEMAENMLHNRDEEQ